MYISRYVYELHLGEPLVWDAPPLVRPDASVDVAFFSPKLGPKPGAFLQGLLVWLLKWGFNVSSGKV